MARRPLEVKGTIEAESNQRVRHEIVVGQFALNHIQQLPMVLALNSAPLTCAM
jgi:hypothetical protein